MTSLLYLFRTVRPIFLRALPALLVAACSSSGQPGGTGGSGAGVGTAGGSGPVGREPAHHRPSAAACTEPRPPANQGDPGAACETDADCTAGLNGRCISNIQGPECSYDACTADADCGGVSVCKCRLPDTNSPNECFFGNCVVDADCGAGGYCSPSATDLGASCSEGISPGSIGYFCHTPADECIDDADCGNPEEKACIFQVDTARWSCFTLMCVD